DIKNRIHDAADIRIALAGVDIEPSSEQPKAERTGIAPSFVAIACVIAVIAGAGGAWFLKPAPAPKTSVPRASLDVQPADQLGRNDMGAAGTTLISVRPGGNELAISPNGHLIAFSGTKGDVTQLYLRPIDEPHATPIAGTEGAHIPFFSPDGQAIGFWADGKLKRTPTAGGSVSVICDAASPPPL